MKERRGETFNEWNVCGLVLREWTATLESGSTELKRRDTDLAAIVNPNNTKLWCSDLRK